MWHINLKLSGNASTSSPSISPVTDTESNVRYATLTPFSAPEWHSARNSARLVALGTTMSAISAMEAHVEWALEVLAVTFRAGLEFG